MVSTYTTQAFPAAAQYASPPLVLASVVTYSGKATVKVRVKDITTSGFSLRLQEQDSISDGHMTETIAYVAWDLGTGSIGDMTYEALVTTQSIDENFSLQPFDTTFSTPPAVLAAMQNTRGADAATVRWANLGVHEIEIAVQEEQSADSETTHCTEKIGLLLLGSQ